MGNEKIAVDSHLRQLLTCFFLTFAVLSAVNLYSLVNNPWLKFPPKYFSDGVDYEAIGWGLSHNLGLSTHFSSPQWREAYLAVGTEDYDRVARQDRPIVPRTDRPPLLPMIIAASYLSNDDRTTAFVTVRVILALCLSAAGGIACALSFHLSTLATRKLNERNNSPKSYFVAKYVPVASAAACLLIAAVDQTAKSYMEDMLTELPMLFLTQLFVISLLRSLYRSTAKFGGLWTGVIFGLLFLTRSISILWLPFLVLLLPYLRFTFTTNRDFPTTTRWKEAASPLIPLMIAFLFVASPWMIWNCLVLDGFYPLGTKGSTTLVGGYCDEAVEQLGNWSATPERGIRERLNASYGQKLEFDTQANLELEKQAARESMQMVRTWIKHNWSTIPRLFVLRIYTHFNPYGGKSGIAKALAVLGILLGLKLFRRETLLLASLVFINALVVGLLYSVGGRFFVPMYGILYTFASCGFVLGGFTLVQVLAYCLNRRTKLESQCSNAS